MNVLLIGRMPAAGVDRLRERLGAGHRVTVCTDPRTIEPGSAEVGEAEVIVGGPVNEAIVAEATRLRLFHVFRGGADGLGVDLLPPSVPVCNTFRHEIGVAEFAVMASLMLPRRIRAHDAMLRRGDWSGSVMWGEPPEYRSLAESEVLVVGAGHIGRAIIERLQGFGPRIVVVSRDPGRKVSGADRVAGYNELHAALATADVVILSVRLAPQTTALIGAGELSRMSPHSCLVNVSRGGVVDQYALYDALRDGGIAAAAIDVWYNYPTDRDERCLPADAPLHELDNVLLSPNRSSWTRQMLADRIDDVAENIERLDRGDALLRVIRPAANANPE